jgi:HAD superfamily hydrolase (TIGR01509 family)
VAHPEACFLDAYDTIVHTDYSVHGHELLALAGISTQDLYSGFGLVGAELSIGRISMAEAFAEILRAAGVEPAPGLPQALADKSRELLLRTARLYDDVLPFMRELRSRGIKIGIISNCDENTRGLLVDIGVTDLADALILSNEVGVAKPAAEIYQYALDKLGVTGPDALFADDNATYCAGAAALGIRAFQMLRESPRDTPRVPGGPGMQVDDGQEPVRGPAVIQSLSELEPFI